MTIFWHPTGPRIRYVEDMLYIDDLNPENHMRWKMSRWEMIKTGVMFLISVLR